MSDPSIDFRNLSSNDDIVDSMSVVSEESDAVSVSLTVDPLRKMDAVRSEIES